MNNKKISAIYYSPTHTSAKICSVVARAVNSTGIDVNYCELTYKAEEDKLHFTSDDLVVVSVPVYCSRVAPVAIERLAKIKGNNTPAIAIVVYGNRDYGDALLELCDVLKEKGFVTIAAAAFIGEHSYSRTNMPIAQGRPDDADVVAATVFGEKCRVKLDACHNIADFLQLKVDGNTPYFVVNHSAPTAPTIDVNLCNQCGVCIDNCPVEAISYQNGAVMCNVDLCTKCCRCVKECPHNAVKFITPYTELLHKNCAVRREPQIFM